MMTDLMLMLSPVNLIIFVLVMGRLSGMIATAPFFSTIQAPMQAKAILVFMTAFIMYPIVAVVTTFSRVILRLLGIKTNTRTSINL